MLRAPKIQITLPYGRPYLTKDPKYVYSRRRLSSKEVQEQQRLADTKFAAASTRLDHFPGPPHLD